MNFICFGKYESTDALIRFILTTCKKDFYFAHRVWWVLNSMDPSGSKVKINDLKICVEKITAESNTAESNKIYVSKSELLEESEHF